jgi:hypothetical protein
LVYLEAKSLEWGWDSVRRGELELVRSEAKARDRGWDLAQALLEWAPDSSARSLCQPHH